MLFAKIRTNFDGTPKTKKELFEDFSYKVNDIMDRHPIAFIAITCGTAHIAGHTILHYATKPPANNGKSKETVENCEY